MSSPQVGQAVQYLGHEGTPFAAIVTMTALTHNPDKDPSGKFEPGDGDSVSLMVFRPSGSAYARHNVPRQDSAAHAALVQAAEDYDKVAEMAAKALDDDEPDLSDPTPKPVVRCWTPLS
jgi:hypothetical protein